MGQQISKSVLPEPESRLIELLQSINFGRIERLQVRNGAPVFEPGPLIIKKLKMGGHAGSRPEAGLTDFLLKKQVIELLETIRDIGNGEIRSIEVAYGLPHLVELEGEAGVQVDA